MSEALKNLYNLGYSTNFTLEGDTLRTTDTSESFKASDLSIVDSYRFEGESDPDDMAVLYVVESNTGRKGTLVDAFGTYASKELGDFINEIKDIRDEKEPTKALPAEPLPN